ncbi:MAG: hypothetical protein ACE5GN_03065 [Waddliaceae bacterium]
MSLSPVSQPTQVVTTTPGGGKAIHLFDPQRDARPLGNSTNTDEERGGHISARSYWESVSESLEKLCKFKSELKKARTSELQSIAVNGGLGVTGLVGTVLGGAPVTWPIACILLACAGNGVKSIWNDAQNQKSLQEALEDIKKGLQMMEALNEENVKDARDLAQNIHTSQELLQFHREKLREIELDLRREGVNIDRDIRRNHQQYKQMVGQLELCISNLAEAEARSSQAREAIRKGLVYFRKANEVAKEMDRNGVQNAGESEALSYENFAKLATDCFLDGLSKMDEARALNRGGVAALQEAMSQLGDYCQTVELAQKATQRQLERAARTIDGQKAAMESMQGELEEAAGKATRVEKRLRRERAVGKATQEKVDYAAAHAKDEDDWGMRSTFCAAAAVPVGCLVGRAVPAPGSGTLGGIAAAKTVGNYVHQKRRELKKQNGEFLKNMDLEDPTNRGQVIIKFGSTQTWWNMLSLTNARKWKDSRTEGVFKINIGGEVYAYVFDRSVRGGGSLSFQESLQLHKDLTAALDDSKIAPRECMKILDYLAQPVTVRCERYEGWFQNERFTLIDCNDGLFKSLRIHCAELEREGLGDSLCEQSRIF